MSTRRELLKGLVAVPIITAGSDLLAGTLLPLDVLSDLPKTRTGDPYVRSVNQYLVGIKQAELNPSEERKVRDIIQQIEESAEEDSELKESLNVALAVAVATTVGLLRDLKH